MPSGALPSERVPSRTSHALTGCFANLLKAGSGSMSHGEAFGERFTSGLLSPEVTAAFTRLVSAALSPMPCKVGRPEAKEGLACITRKMLPRRACVVKRMKVEHAERLAQLAREAALEVQREEVRHGAVVRRRREAVAERKTRSTRHISNTTKTTWS